MMNRTFNELDSLDREVWEIAELLISRYGERAVAHASLQALKARVKRNGKVMAAWRRISEAAEHMLRQPDFDSEPDFASVARAREPRGPPHPANTRGRLYAPALGD